MHSFLNLEPTLGKSKSTPFNELEFRSVDFAKEFGIVDLDVKGIDNLRKRIQADEKLREDYMIKIIGYDPKIPGERKKAMSVYEKKDLAKEVSPGVYSSWNFICLMTKNISVDEYESCTLKDPSSSKHQKLP